MKMGIQKGPEFPPSFAIGELRRTGPPEFMLNVMKCRNDNNRSSILCVSAVK